MPSTPKWRNRRRCEVSRRQLATVYNFVANSLEVGDGIAATISLSRSLAKLDSFRCCKNCPHQRILAVGAMAPLTPSSSRLCSVLLSHRTMADHSLLWKNPKKANWREADIMKQQMYTTTPLSLVWPAFYCGVTADQSGSPKWNLWG